MTKTLVFIVICSVMLLAAQNYRVDAADKSVDLIAAIKSGDASNVSQALAAGADANARIQGGVTALIAAAFEGNVQIVKLLLDKGANVNAQTDKGVTALMIAAGKGFKEMAQLLIEKGADANIEEASGVNAFRLAMAAGHQDTANLLKSHTKVTAIPTTKTVVGSLEKGQSCLPVMNFPNEAQKKIKCLRAGEEVSPTGVTTNTNWSLIQKPVLGWVPADRLKELVATEDQTKPATKQGSSARKGSEVFTESPAAGKGTDTSSADSLPTSGRGGGEHWRR